MSRLRGNSSGGSEQGPMTGGEYHGELGWKQLERKSDKDEPGMVSRSA